MSDNEALEAAEANDGGPTVLPRPESVSGEDLGSWTVIAHNKNVVEGWRYVCRQIPDNAARCYAWLRMHPTRGIPRRCYALKHKHYAGVGAFEVGASDRVYYRPRQDRHDVLVFYAGPHPKRGIPYPPPEDEG